MSNYVFRVNVYFNFCPSPLQTFPQCDMLDQSHYNASLVYASSRGARDLG